MSAWVSPPQLSSSYIVQTTASMAHAASTALPPRSKMRAPAVAPGGLPVMATQWRPCRTGLCVAEYGSGVAATHQLAMNRINPEMRNENVCMVSPDFTGCLRRCQQPSGARARSEAAVTSAAGVEDPAEACPQDQSIWTHSDIEAIQAMMQRQRCKSRKARKCLAQPVILANEKNSEGQL